MPLCGFRNAQLRSATSHGLDDAGRFAPRLLDPQPFESLRDRRLLDAGG
jgi:hypothetical protein